MRIVETFKWSRRDFYFVAECQNCFHRIDSVSGYDDSNFYDNVLGNMECPNCKLSNNSMTGPRESYRPRYNPALVM